ncbi:cellulose production protein [Escherichia coli]|nr:cellulose production protein [Escherichia coli]
MPAGGVWWFNVHRHENAISLANPTIATQAETAHVPVISIDRDPRKILQLASSPGPQKKPLYSIPKTQKGCINFVLFF